VIARGTAAMGTSAAVGVWLYVAPGVLGYEGAQATSDRIAGALVVSLSFVAVWEFMRGLRLANRPIALWLAVSPALFQPAIEVAASTVASALVVLALSFVRGEIGRPYGGGWRALVRSSE
jgi:hypothetical protein